MGGQPVPGLSRDVERTLATIVGPIIVTYAAALKP